MPGGYIDGLIVEMVGIADDLGGRLLIPGHNADRIDFRPHIDVDGGIVDGGGLPHIAAVNREGENLLRNPQPTRAIALEELARRQDLAARRPRHIGDKAFDLADLAMGEPFFKLRLRHDEPRVVDPTSVAGLCLTVQTGLGTPPLMSKSTDAPSYYQATAQPFPPQPSLKGDVTADVCVIGAGYTGL